MKKSINPLKIAQFKPMREPLSIQEAIKEANRCLLCYDAPCSDGCPAGTDPGKFIRQIKFYNYKGAARTIQKNNILGSVCAHICPVEKLCEQKCSVQALDVPININGLQRFASEYGKKFGIEPLEKVESKDTKIAIIGAGPAGIGCASVLAKNGYNVTIFEKENEAGGVLHWNIPEFRLPEEAIGVDFKNLLDLGVNIKYNKKIDSVDGVQTLLKENYKAVFIGTGLSEAFRLDMFEGFSNAVDYISFLREVKINNGYESLVNKNVAIIGGGSVAIDSAVSAKACGAKKVYLISLEHLDELPADKEEIELARKMNIIFKSGSQVIGLVSDKGKITQIKGKEIDWIESGKFIPENARQISGTKFSINVDLVIQAIGTKPGKEIKKFAGDLKTFGKGIIVVNENFETNIPGIFAGGDISNGGATVVQAVGEGKKAAESIDRYLKENEA
jgi:dihydropyrimidine dehydrogenase (NAD+) subunit PreT